MSTSYGWGGKVLDIDLASGRIKRETLSRDLAIKHIGGASLMAKMLYDEVDPAVEPLSPENVILIGQGALVGTLAPSGGRYEIATKSPLTGIYGRSNGGGNFGPEMKWAGYDIIKIRGKAPKPVYINIQDDRVEIRDAAHLWGKTISVSRRMLCDELGDPETATLLIGPAGEHLCLQSAVISDLSRAAGKNSIGAVFGSKNLKGVAIRGTQGVRVARPAEFLKLCKTLLQRIKQDPLYETHSKYGTLSWVGTAYSSSPVGKALTGGLGGAEIEDKAFDPLIEKNLACFGCPLHCSHFLRVKEGKYKGAHGEGLEGNVQIWGFGMRILSAPFLVHYNSLCNELGLNADSPGTAINWAMHLWQNGVISKEDTGGLDLSWGNEESALELTRQIAYKEGFGAVLDGYPLRAAQQIGHGSEKWASHGKGSYTYNVGPGTGTTLHYTLALNMSNRGYDHLSGGPSIYTHDFRQRWGLTNELLTGIARERYGDPNAFEPWTPSLSKALVVYDFENNCATADTAGLCKFAMWFCLCVHGINMTDVSHLLTEVTGETFTPEDVKKAAERQYVVERAFNARQGMRRVDDYPFVFRWLIEKGEPNPVFDYDKLPIKLETYDKVMDEYYRLRGCDPKTAIPTRAKLNELGLQDIAADLAKRGLLPMD
ncbi:MAG: hypothetical protein HY670_12700 [Chloroflexi bacterium]|nr:hypothetical protein [Chloroflexota bacterium]